MNRMADTLLVKPLSLRRGENVWLRRALISVTVVVLVNAFAGKGGLSQSLRAQREYAQAQAQLSALQRENAALATEMRGLSRDARMIESVAREEFGLIRPGEVMFVLRMVR